MSFRAMKCYILPYSPIVFFTRYHQAHFTMFLCPRFRIAHSVLTRPTVARFSSTKSPTTATPPTLRGDGDRRASDRYPPDSVRFAADGLDDGTRLSTVESIAARLRENEDKLQGERWHSTSRTAAGGTAGAGDTQVPGESAQDMRGASSHDDAHTGGGLGERVYERARGHDIAPF
eukprot:Opistho-2@30408